MKNLILICLITSTLLSAKETILWAESSFSPVYITKGDMKGQGYEQLQENDIRKYLSNYEHKIEEYSAKRTLYMQKHLPNICNGKLKNKQREKFLHFSVALNALFPNGLFINKNQLYKFKKYINSVGELNLEQVVLSNTFKLTFKKKRAYGKHIDSIINKYSKSSTFLQLDKGDSNQLQLLKNKRIDGYFVYPIEAQFHIRNENKEDFAFLPIIIDSYTPTYIACSKTTQGKQIIDDINEYILLHRENTLLEHYIKWLDKDTARKIRENSKEIFKELDNR